MRRLWPIAVGIALAFFALGVPGTGAEEKNAPTKDGGTEKFVLTGPVTFPMEEVSAFAKDEVAGIAQYRFAPGSYALCTTQPSKQVKKYPKLNSRQPLYGSITFGGPSPGSGDATTYQFVLDESGVEEMPSEKEKATGKEQAEEKPGSAKARKPTSKARTTAGRYDRLYFDLNRDLDLTDDPVVTLAKRSPFDDPSLASNLLVFTDLPVPFDYGPPHGIRPFRIVPWLSMGGQGRAALYFCAAVARKGKIRLGDEEYAAYLTQSRAISGRFDRPFVDIEFYPTNDKAEASSLLKSGVLGEMRRIDGRLISVSATPLGDKLTIQPYAGPLGVLEVGPGGRAITDLGVTGNLVSAGNFVPLKDAARMPPEILPRRQVVPVGDYQPLSLTIQYGRLRFESRAISSPGPVAKPPVYSVRVRKDQPCVLEFSGKPAVQFMNPREGQAFKPGDTVAIKAMLTEPWQGIMITGLWDTTKKKGVAKYREGGKEITAPQYERLDPNIVIRDSHGKQVAEGKMPFG